MERQLDESLDHYITITPDEILASGAVLSRVSLMPYGYTFIGKGIPGELQDDAFREAEVYSCQGSKIPVCLGAIDLQRIFFVHPKICIKQLPLLSWAGKPTDITQIAPGTARESYRRVLKATKGRISGYNSMHAGNILWNSHRRRIQLVNFESPECRPRKFLLHQVGHEESLRWGKTTTTQAMSRLFETCALFIVINASR